MLVEDVKLLEALIDAIPQVVVQSLLHGRLDIVEGDELVLLGRELAKNSLRLEAIHMLLDELVDDSIRDFRLVCLHLFLGAMTRRLPLSSLLLVGEVLHRRVILMLERLLEVVIDGQYRLEFLTIMGHVSMNDLIDDVGDL